MSPIHDANAEVTGEQLRGIPEGSVEDAQKVAYAELIGEGDYLSAARLAQAYPHVIEPYESHHQWVRQHQERTRPIDDLPDCPACGQAIHQQSKHATPGYHRRCSIEKERNSS